jgi:diaminopimelate decarboxylase
MGLPAPTIIDFGGGFGVPEDESEPELDLSQLKKGMERIFNQEVEKLTNLGLQQTVFESGRYLVSRAGMYVASVVDVKRSRGKQFAILDGGINNLGIRQLMYRTFEPQLEVWMRSGQKGELTTFVGPTCTPIDIVHKGIEVPDIKVGDLVIIHNFGAYSISYSPVHFCGHPWPAEVLVRADGSYRLVRRRGRLEESCGLGYIT